MPANQNEKQTEEDSAGQLAGQNLKRKFDEEQAAIGNEEKDLEKTADGECLLHL